MIKVGDWVTYKSTGEIARVRVVDNDRYINGVCIDDCIKLPIKFSEFEVLEGVEIIDTRYVKETDKMYHFTATPSKSSTLIRVFISLFVDGNWAYVVNSCSKETIEEAKDWLELQYATMLAKARGLI